MRFDRVKLANFKCYADADLALHPGVTVIHGLNGSGKSSLLEACFFALYGARALDTTLDEVVTIGAEDATIELWFTHAGESYHLERRVRLTDDRATTAKCVLETPDDSIEGARDVRAYVTELLRMDAEAFVNCAYVRQGEVNKLINASPSERQDMIDDLLQLGKLETYRERASKARLGVMHVRDAKQELLDDVANQIERKEEKDLHERLNDLQTRLTTVDEEIDRFEENRENAIETRDEADSILEEYAEKRERLDELATEITDLTDQITETETEREELADRIQERKDDLDSKSERRDDLLAETDLSEATPEAIESRIADLEDEDEDLRSQIEQHRLTAQEHASEADSLREAAEELDERATANREQAATLEQAVEETRETLADRREKIDTLRERIEEKRAVFENAPVDVGEAEAHRDSVADECTEIRERETELEATLEAERESLREAEQLLEAGNCPECGQPVADSPHVDAIEEDRERVADLEAELDSVSNQREELDARLDTAEGLVDAETDLTQLRTNLDNIQQLVAEQEATLDTKESQLTELRQEADDLEADAKSKREQATEAAEQAATVREKIADCNERRSDLRDRLDRLESLQATVEQIGEITEEIDRLRDQRATKAEINDQRRERLADKRDRKTEIEAEFDESAIEEAKTEKERAQKYIEQVEPKLAEFREERDEITGKIGGVKQELDALEELRERHEELSATVEHLDSVYEETEQLQELYGTLRAQLRQRNVESLERMLNETFELVYQNDSYARIELDGEYELTVYQKDGEPLDPEQLSGGERALFNLSLRCAIYRLLAEGIEGSAPMPPLILDEPTVFLDAGHVSQLVELIEAMRDLGVEQIVVVSHDEELVGAADDLVLVEKDATTNRSTVEREDADLDALALL